MGIRPQRRVLAGLGGCRRALRETSARPRGCCGVSGARRPAAPWSSLLSDCRRGGPTDASGFPAGAASPRPRAAGGATAWVCAGAASAAAEIPSRGRHSVRAPGGVLSCLGEGASCRSAVPRRGVEGPLALASRPFSWVVRRSLPKFSPTRLETRTKESNLCASDWVSRSPSAK